MEPSVLEQLVKVCQVTLISEDQETIKDLENQTHQRLKILLQKQYKKRPKLNLEARKLQGEQKEVQVADLKVAQANLDQEDLSQLQEARNPQGEQKVVQALEVEVAQELVGQKHQEKHLKQVRVGQEDQGQDAILGVSLI